jgi:transposase-like protein
MIEYYLKQPPEGEASLTFLDAAGQAIQQFSTQAKDNRRMPAEVGVNRFLWDMRYPNARDVTSGVQLAAFEASRPAPPVAPPGRYVVRLTVGGQTYERPFEIRKDPRTTASDADLQAQFALVVKIRDRVSEVADALNRLRDARRQLEERQKRGPASPATAPIRQKLLTIEGQLTRLVGSHPLEVTPKGIINKLGTLSGVVGSGEARPTKQDYALFEDLSARFAVQLRQLDEVIGKDLPALMK